MRVVLFTGKGGVGKTTTASATALGLADRGVKTLLLSTDTAHSLADALGVALSGDPTEVAPALWVVQIDTQGRFEAAWRDVQGFLAGVLARSGVDPITADELTVLPGIDEVLALLAVRELARTGDWDTLVVDCAPTAETLRLLALPEALSWYLQKVFPAQRRLARGMRPFATLLGRGEAIPPDHVFAALLRLTDELAGVQQLLGDPATTSVRLVLTPEAVVAAEARRTFTALALYGYAVDMVIANRVFPDGADAWRAGWAARSGSSWPPCGSPSPGCRCASWTTVRPNRSARRRCASWRRRCTATATRPPPGRRSSCCASTRTAATSCCACAYRWSPARRSTSPGPATSWSSPSPGTAGC